MEFESFEDLEQSRDRWRERCEQAANDLKWWQSLWWFTVFAGLGNWLGSVRAPWNAMVVLGCFGLHLLWMRHLGITTSGDGIAPSD